MSPALDKAMRFGTILAVLVPLALSLAAPAHARGTLDSILPQIRAAYPGQLSDAQPYSDASGNLRYRIKWMTPEGRILYFDADPRTGRFSSAGGDVGYPRRFRPADEGGYDNGSRHNTTNGDQDNDGGRRSHWNGDGDGGNWSGDWRGGNDGRSGDRHDGGDGRGNSQGGDWRRGTDDGDNGGRRGHHDGG